MAQDYDLARPEVAERSEETIIGVRETAAPDARSVVAELDEADSFEELELPGAIVGEELIVRVIPPAADEFTCGSCFLVRHRSQLARSAGSARFCRDCEY